jgi:GNAT superfamily N-acetyltransferase
MKMNALTVRRFEINEFNDVVLLWSSAFGCAFPDLYSRFTLTEFSAKLEDILGDGHHVWVVVESEGIRGFASIHHRLIRNLFIAPENQRKGFGTCLISAMKQEYGAPLFVQTLAVHWQARAFYRKLGFEFFAERPSGFEGLTEVIYRWDGAR